MTIEDNAKQLLDQYRRRAEEAQQRQERLEAARARGRFTMADVKEFTYKRRDAWWTVVLVDPLAARMLLPLANHTRLTPNQTTFIALLFGLSAAACFWIGSYTALVIGAVLYHLSFTLDCIDGKLARLKGTGSVFGQWLDYIFDRLRVLSCSVTLFSGQFRITGRPIFLYLAFVVIFLDMLRYMDALQVYKIRREMKKKIAQAKRDMMMDTQDELLTDDEPEDQEAFGRQPEVIDLQQEFKSKFGWYMRTRDALERWRVRPHLFSGIEFQMFVFIIAPLVGVIEPVVIGAAAALLAFELAIIYKLWLSTKDLNRQLARIRSGEQLAFPGEIRARLMMLEEKMAQETQRLAEAEKRQQRAMQEGA